MSEGINIPGVSDKYKTNDLVNSLMAVERKPLEREKENLEKYNAQQSAWRDVNQKMTTLRESVKTLYSFENPFSNKLTSSSQEAAVTADAGREADFGSFQIDVINPATADRFLSGNIDKDMKVPAGNYNYKVGEKTIHFNWKGGKLSDWVNSLNKRGGQYIKASLIGVSKNQQSLLLESLKTGEENRLIFEDAALDFAKQTEMVESIRSEKIHFDSTPAAYTTPETKDSFVQQNLPLISKENVTVQEGKINLPPRSGVTVSIPASVKSSPQNKIEFTVSEKEINDITVELNSVARGPEISSSGGIEFKGVSVYNNLEETTLVLKDPATIVPVQPVSNNSLLFVKNSDGTETPVDITQFAKDSVTGERTVKLDVKDFPNAESLVLRNSNTGKQYLVSVPDSYNEAEALGFAPVHAITQAADAKFKYEGITLTRPDNDIDDVVPHITLHLHEPTEKTANIKIEPDKESAKDALITFVGKYNQTIAELNILYQNKPEIINELDYLTDDEIEKQTEKLGMFFGDTTITSGKNSLQQIIANNYRFSEDAEITMLSQIGISTNASSGSSGYNAAQLRGYLEIDEKKLDSALENNLTEIKNIFGFDQDGDLIIDDGIGYKLDKQLTAWVQSGGILSTKTSALERSIKSSNTKITRLEEQLDKKEQELKRKYASMEGTLNSLESQSNTISNFSKQNSGNNK